jgi:hypothetical protein
MGLLDPEKEKANKAVSLNFIPGPRNRCRRHSV